MNFLFDAETWAIIAVIASVAAIIFGVRFARSRGVDTDQLAKDIATGIDLGKVIAPLINIQEGTKKKIFVILEVADLATELAVKTNIAKTREEEKVLAKEYIGSAISQLGFQVTPEQIAMIEAAIEIGVDYGTERNTVEVVKNNKI